MLSPCSFLPSASETSFWYRTSADHVPKGQRNLTRRVLLSPASAPVEIWRLHCVDCSLETPSTRSWPTTHRQTSPSMQARGKRPTTLVALCRWPSLASLMTVIFQVQLIGQTPGFRLSSPTQMRFPKMYLSSRLRVTAFVWKEKLSPPRSTPKIVTWFAAGWKNVVTLGTNLSSLELSRRRPAMMPTRWRWTCCTDGLMMRSSSYRVPLLLLRIRSFHHDLELHFQIYDIQHARSWPTTSGIDSSRSGDVLLMRYHCAGQLCTSCYRMP